VKFDIKDCTTGGCHLCLTSTCLNLDGQCPSGGSGCKTFTPGNVNGDCGDYLRDCSQDGGWDATWEVDATDCLPPESELDCSSITINVTCYPRVNPAGQGLDRLCKDCDCVCECVFIDYEETTSCTSKSHFECWAGSWSSSFVCEYGDQDVLVELERDTVTGCCNWRVTITKGLIIPDDETPPVSKTAIYKTACPDIDLTINIDLGEGDSAILTIRCGPCALAVNCCPILLFYPELIVTGDIAGTPTSGGSAECDFGWFGGVNPGPSAEFTSVADFVICCLDGTEGESGKFRITFNIASSAPCLHYVDVTFEQEFPCCPLDRTFVITGVPVACQASGTLTFRIQTPGDPPCPPE